MKTLTCVTSLLLMLAAGSPAGAQGFGTDDPELPTDLSRMAGQLVQSACSHDTRKSQPASAALGDLQLAISQPLIEGLNSGDPEVHARIEEILHESLFQAALAGATRNLTPDRRLMLEGLIRKRRQAIEPCFVGDEDGRTFAILRFRQTDDRNKQLEPLLLALINGSSIDNAAAASMVATDLNYSSQALAEAIAAKIAMSYTVSARSMNTIDYRYQHQAFFAGNGGALPALVNALFSMQDKTSRLTPLLMGMLMENPNTPSGQIPMSMLTETLIKNKELGVIPTLIERLDGASSFIFGSRGPNGAQLSVRQSDAAFFVLLSLTKQTPASYGCTDLTSMGYANPFTVPVAFDTDKARTAAYTKFREWWAQASQSAPYKDIKPIELVKPGEWNKRAASTQTASTVADSSSPSSADETGATQIDGLQDRLGAVVRKQIGMLGSSRPSQRRNAQNAILAIQSGFFRTVASQLGQEDPGMAAEVVRGMHSEAKLALIMCDLSAEDRAKLLQFRKAQGDVLRDITSENPEVVVSGLRSLGRKDVQHLAEPLVIYCLVKGTAQHSSAAADLIAAGHYKSQAINDALVLALSQCDVQQYGSGNSGMTSILKAIRVARPPEAVPVLMAHVLSFGRGNYYQINPEMFELLENYGSKQPVPNIVERLRAGSQGPVYGSSIDGKPLSWTDSDYALYLALSLTNQSPADYGMIVRKAGPHLNVVGFTDEKARSAGVKKFLGWWDEHKDQPEYKDLKPVVIPQLKPRPVRNYYMEIQQMMYGY